MHGSREKPVRLLFYAGLLSLSAGCAGAPPPVVLVPSSAPPGETLVLLGMPDGKVVRLNAAVGADVCVQSVPLDLVSCYKKGQARRDPNTHEIIGYEMERIEYESP